MSDAKKPGPCPHCARPIGVEYVEVEPGKCQLWRWMVEVGSNTPGTPAPRTVSDCFGHTSRRIRELEAKVADLDAQAKAARKALARHHEAAYVREHGIAPPRDMFPDDARIE